MKLEQMKPTIRTTSGLVKRLKADLPLIGSLTRIDDNKIHSGMAADRPAIFAAMDALGVGYAVGPGAYITVNFPA